MRLLPPRKKRAVERLLAEAKKAGKNLDPAAAAALADQAGTDWGILSGELEKALLFAGKATEIGHGGRVGEHGLSQGDRSPGPSNASYPPVDLKACLTYLREAFAHAKPDEVVFRSSAQARAAYLKQIKAKRMLKTGSSPREIEIKLRIFYDRDFFARAKRVSEERLRRDLRRCSRSRPTSSPRPGSMPRSNSRMSSSSCAPPPPACTGP